MDPQTVKNIGAALLKAQIEIQQTDVKKAGENPHFKSSYAELPDVIDAVIPVLNKNGIVVVQLPTDVGQPNVLALTTLLLHAESGESVSGTAVTPLGKEDPQGYMAAITYLRRGSLMSALGLKAVDDDGEAAVGRLPAIQSVPVKVVKGREIVGTKPLFKTQPQVSQVVNTAKPVVQKSRAPIFPKVGQPATQEGGDDGQDGEENTQA